MRQNCKIYQIDTQQNEWIKRSNLQKKEKAPIVTKIMQMDILKKNYLEKAKYKVTLINTETVENREREHILEYIFNSKNRRCQKLHRSIIYFKGIYVVIGFLAH